MKACLCIAYVLHVIIIFLSWSFVWLRGESGVNRTVASSRTKTPPTTGKLVVLAIYMSSFVPVKCRQSRQLWSVIEVFSSTSDLPIVSRFPVSH